MMDLTLAIGGMIYGELRYRMTYDELSMWELYAEEMGPLNPMSAHGSRCGSRGAAVHETRHDVAVADAVARGPEREATAGLHEHPTCSA